MHRLLAHRLLTAVLLLPLLLARPGAASATDWTTDPETSKLEFVGEYMEDELFGRFERFTPQIRFDRAELAGARFDVEIDLASARTGDEEWDGYLAGAEFFNVEAGPKARYTAETFEARGEGFVALGTLELRGIRKPVALEFSFEESADGARLVGTADFNRLDFEVGLGEWEDPEMIGHPVRVETTLTLKR